MSVDYADWQTPQANATSISTTGVPLLRGSKGVGSALAATLAPVSATEPLVQVAITQPSWELQVIPHLPAAAGTVPFFEVTMFWFTSATSTVVAIEKIVIPSANGATTGLCTFGLHGPSLGDLLTLEFRNLDPAQTCTYDWVFSQASHTYKDIEVFPQGYPSPAPNGFTYPSGDPRANIIANFQTSIGAAGTQSRLLTTAPGRWRVSLDNPGAGSVDIVMTLPSGSSIAAGNEIWSFIATSTKASAEMIAPYEPVLMSITNNGSVGVTPKVGIIRCDY